MIHVIWGLVSAVRKSIPAVKSAKNIILIFPTRLDSLTDGKVRMRKERALYINVYCFANFTVLAIIYNYIQGKSTKSLLCRDFFISDNVLRR